MRKVLIVLWLVALVASVPASAAAQPVSIERAGDLISLGGLPVVDAPQVDLAAVTAEDVERRAEGLPHRFAIANAVAITPQNDGVWESLDKGLDVWRVRVSSPGARSLNLGFTQYEMPQGGRMMIFAGDLSSSVRPFTAADNKPHGQLWTPAVSTDELVIEVTVPAASRDQLKLHLSSINVGYVGFGRDDPLPESGACNVDVVCNQGNNWRDEIPSVAGYSTGGSLFCTGGMINNTAQDQRPLFLTADHCGIGTGNAASLVVYWNFETTVCGGTPDGQLSDFQTGSSFLADYATSDFTLLELDSAPDPAWGVTWAGWDRSGADASSAVAIHHPSGDEKRISFENQATTITSYSGTAVPGDGTHVRVIDWDDGTTEGGSSGSPLFDQNHRVIGQLHGGGAACGNNLSDWYGRLFRSWTGGGSASSRLSDHLDPGGSGAMTVDTLVPAPTGGCCNGATCTVETQADCTGGGGTYLGDGASCTTAAGNPTTYSATVNGAIPDGGGSGNALTNTINVPTSYTVGDVDIDYNITHTYVGDLTVELTHGGVTVTVMDRPGHPASSFGCNQANMDVSIDDGGSGGTIEGQCTANLSSPPSYTPNQALSAFNGLDATGNWTIKVYDNASQDSGSLVDWAVRIDAEGPSPCGCNTNADCDDNLFCNGAETCQGGSCQNGTDPCPGQGCDEGTDSCVTETCNNDGDCDSGEDCNNCDADCISGGGAGFCGDLVCQPSLGEDCNSCAGDCRGKQNGNPNRQYCCGGDVTCADSRCNTDPWVCDDAPGETYCCGDTVCEGDEDSCNCAIDCGAPAAEICDNGVDDDCDSLVDCDDTVDCPASHPACQITCDGDGICDPGEDCNSCSSDCASKLNGNPAGRYCCGNGVQEGPEGDGRCDGNV